MFCCYFCVFFSWESICAKMKNLFFSLGFFFVFFCCYLEMLEGYHFIMHTVYTLRTLFALSGPHLQNFKRK